MFTKEQIRRIKKSSESGVLINSSHAIPLCNMAMAYLETKLTAEQQNSLVAAIKILESTATISNSELFKYAKEIRNILENQGWRD